MEETLVYSDFVIMQRLESKLAPGNHYTEEIGVRCPRCDAVVPKMVHGSPRDCVCGLTLTKYGNALVLHGMPPS